MAGAQIGNYHLLKKLATGGMAEVWLANQLGIQGFNRHIVVKRILPHLSEDPEFVQMFLNEAKIASRFNHPNIAQIYDLGQGDGQYFIAMEFIHGEDLGRLMRKAWSTGQWIARPLAIRIIAEACKGLFYAHTRNDETGRPLRVVHRDISPQNILISFDGSVKLVDFGIAKAADQASMTKSGAIKGKFAYMAPEQAGGKPLDARTDLFALGLVLYELLTGVRPLKRDSELATLQAALECAIDPPSVVAEVPGELDEVVMRALAKAPDDRYRDASAFQMALEEFLISQRLVATSVQIAELMETLFAERRAEEQRLGAPNPSVQGESQQGLPAMPELPARRERATPSQDGEPEVTGNTDSGGRPSESGGDGAGDWEAPPAPAQVLPSRRYSSMANPSPQTAMQRGHSPGAPETTRQKPATREFEEYDDPSQASSPSGGPRRPRIGLKRPSNGVNGAGHARVVEPGPTMDGGAEVPVMPRRSSSSAGRLKRAGSDEMPEAPPRRSREGLDGIEERDERFDKLDKIEPVEKPERTDKKRKMRSEKSKPSELDDATESLAQLRKNQAKKRGLALLGMVAVSAAALAIIFGSGLMGKVNEVTCVPIKLTVTSNPKAHVIVQRNGSLANQPVDLGEAPIEEASGACVGDLILLVNDQLCLRYEESIQFGEPNEVRKIERTFSQANIMINTKPPMKPGINVFCNGQKVGVTGMNMQMYEGPHRLELKDDRLTQSVMFEVTVAPRITNKPNAVELGDIVRK